MSSVYDSTRWNLLVPDEEGERRLVRETGLGPLAARVLAARGMTDVGEVRDFLAPSLDRDWTDPLAIPGMADAADRLEMALTCGETVAVFGDFDVDGTTATAVLALGLGELGMEVYPFIPNRFGEGYGLSREALARVRETCSPDVLVTVDNGIASADEVAWLVGQGVDVVVTDHHEPGDLVPTGVPVADPKCDPSCPSRDLAGVGVALKLLSELGRRRGKPDLWRAYVDLAMFGTVSDMMPLVGENRSIVDEGIRLLRTSPRPGVSALAAVSNTDLTTVTSDQLPFSLIPRLNACGRMGTAELALEVFLTNDSAEATVLAGRLEAINTERRETEAQFAEEALAQAEETYHGGPALVVARAGWHEGVKGIVASRLVNRYHVPSIVFVIDGDVARGSGRSVGSIDLFHAVEQCQDLLVRFGGHEGAVGVTCETEKLDAFRERLEQVMSRLPPEQFEDCVEVAARVRASELTVEGVAGLDVLQPFGWANKRPLLAMTGVFMRNRSCVGVKANHLRFVATDGMSRISAIMFRAPHVEQAVAYEGAVDLVFDAVNETWQGRTRPKLMVKDIIYRSPLTPDVTQELTPDADAAVSADASLTPAGDPAAATEKPGVPSRDLSCLTDELRRSMIGESELLPAQRDALGILGEGRSCLTVMATGRGKSLIFHIHAARVASLSGGASVFVYPLRALVADQVHHLEEALEPFGLSVRVLTGETSQDERREIYDGLRGGTVHVVLTTPEFLAIHAERFARTESVRFLVIDEAHHAGVAKGGTRSAYTELPRVRELLGGPQVLAVTATASGEVALEICRLCGIAEDDVVVDVSERRNLQVVDWRDQRNRDEALVSVVGTGEKCVVYVNSRARSVEIVRMLRHHLGDLASQIAFYHAGLSRATRSQVEENFRSGQVRTIVSTSAFGEGVNLPDIRNVVLYHMPFGRTEFNQMSGRAGRDGRPARVILLFGAYDARVNESILASLAPTRTTLVALYKALRAQGAAQLTAGGDGSFAEDDASLTHVVQGMVPQATVGEGGVANGIAIFSELGLLKTSGHGSSRRIMMDMSPERVSLDASTRHLEGLRSHEAFADFRDWALTADAASMLACVARPISPGFGHVLRDGDDEDAAAMDGGGATS